MEEKAASSPEIKIDMKTGEKFVTSEQLGSDQTILV